MFLCTHTTEEENVVKKFKTKRKVFVDKDKLFVEDKNDLIVYKIFKSSLEQIKRINLQLESISSVRYIQSTLIITGESPSGCFIYLNGVVYNVSSSISSLVEHKDNYFCSSRESIYFIPRDKEIPIKLTGTETIAIENILDNKFSPFVTRTFNYKMERVLSLIEREEDCTVEVDVNCPFVLNRGEGVKMVPEGVVKWVRVPLKKGVCVNGLFLSLLAWQSFKIQLTKTICNVLNFIKKTGKGVEYLNLLYYFNKLSPKSYKAFIELEIDFNRLFSHFYSVIEDFQINKNLFLKCLEFSFFSPNLKFNENQKIVFLCLWGIERYKKGMWFVERGEVDLSLIPFFSRVLKVNEDYVGLFFLYKGSKCPPSLLNPPFSSFKILLNEIQKYKKDKKINCEIKKEEIVDFIKSKGSKEWLTSFLEGEFELVEGINLEVLKECTLNPLYIKKGLSYLFKRGDFKRVARLLFYASKKGIKVENKYYEMVGDYVFVEDNRFVSVGGY